jgi:hypothetical protein
MIPPNNTQEISLHSGRYSAGWRLSKYTAVAQLYFFFNQLFLPKGLLYTQILSPLFFYQVARKGFRTWALGFFGFLVLFNIVHVTQGVNTLSLAISNCIFVLTYFTVVPFYHFVCNYEHLGRLFRQVLVLNGALVIIAIPFLFAPRELQEWFWYFNKLTKGLENFPRLALFTYEASYYSLIMLPVFYYFIMKYLFGMIETHRAATLMLAVLPLMISFSFGVLGATLITGLIMCIINIRPLFRFRRAFLIVSGSVVLLLATIITLFVFFPENALFIRLGNIWSGTDTSARGRTSESFDIAWRIAEMRSIYTGSGLGQVKHVVVEIVRKHYHYWGYLPRYDIPNAMAETLAIFGLAGVALRLFLEIWLFFRTKVYSNYYRLALFIFIFIYQFTGSFITNIAEYSVWLLAFSNVFPVFDRRQRPLAKS